LSSTQRPSSPRRGRIPGPAAAPRPGLREPGRAPDTPSTSWRPALTRRSMPCSKESEPRRAGSSWRWEGRSDERGMGRGVERSEAGSDQRSAIPQGYRRRALSQRSRARPTSAMATPLHSRLQMNTATPVGRAR
jgi:hypothetical protein